MTIDTPSATRIHDQLTIANIAHVRQCSLDCDRVITVCQEPVVSNVSVPYEFYNLSDGDDEYGGECSYELFATAAESLLAALQQGDDVLIHCHRGQSRSASVAIAVLAVLFGRPWSASRTGIETRRPEINPNETLVEFGKRFVAEHG